MNILLVEDEPQMLRALRINIRARGDEVLQAATGAAALTMAARHRPDAAIVDLGLPDMDGLDVIAGIRAFSAMPIMVLSGRGQTEIKVAALDAGADDYLDKPFAIEELVARFRAILRRNPTDTIMPPPPLRIGSWIVDFTTHRVTAAHTEAPTAAAAYGAPANRHQQEQRLTPTEWQIITDLARRPGRLITQTELLETIWGSAFRDESGYLRFHMRQLRRKLEPDTGHPRYFITEPGMGYRLQPDTPTERG